MQQVFNQMIQQTVYNNFNINQPIKQGLINCKIYFNIEIMNRMRNNPEQDFDEFRDEPFTYKQWILLAISEIVGSSNQFNIRIDLNENRITGDRISVQRFMHKAEYQLNVKKMTILKFKRNLPIDLIMFQMDPQWEAKILDLFGLQKVARDITQLYNAQKYIMDEYNNYKHMDGIDKFTRFVWIKDQWYDQAQKIIKKINKICRHQQAKQPNFERNNLQAPRVQNIPNQFKKGQKFQQFRQTYFARDFRGSRVSSSNKFGKNYQAQQADNGKCRYRGNFNDHRKYEEQQKLSIVSSIQVNFKDVEQFYFDKQVQIFIRLCINEYMDTLAHKYMLIQIQFNYEFVEISVKLLNIKMSQEHIINNKLTNQIKKLVSSYIFMNYQFNEEIFVELKKQKYLMKKNKYQKMVLITTPNQSQNKTNAIHSYIANKKQTHSQQLKIPYKSKIEVSLIKQLVDNQINKTQFSFGIKPCTYSQTQDNLKIVFLGQQDIIKKIIAKINSDISSIKDKVFQSYKDFTEQQFDILQKDKQLIKKIQNKFQICVKFDRNLKLEAVITVQTKIKDNKILNTKIIFQKQLNFLSMKENSVFIFRTRKQTNINKQNILDSWKQDLRRTIAQSAKHYNQLTKLTFYLQENANPPRILQKIKSQKARIQTIYMYLPDKNEANKLILELMDAIEQYKQYISTKEQFQIIFVGQIYTNFKDIIKLKQGLNVFVNYNVQVNYNEKVNRITFQYDQKDQKYLIEATKVMSQQLKKKQVTKHIQFDNSITSQLLQEYAYVANSQNVIFSIDKDKKSASISAYDMKKISKYLQRLNEIVKFIKQSIKYCQYPANWQPQTNQIELFVVSEQSKQFQTVQEAFTLAKITQLIRIQNKIIYKRFYQQKLFLNQLNGWDAVKEMNLFHGTGKTDPKKLYQEKEQCFNLNYSRSSNYLGHGAYFAEKSEYSKNYVYNQAGVSSMLYCNVLVGESRVYDPEYRSPHALDTQFKDLNRQIRYESSSSFYNNSNIYVIFKNKRAYPLYLIKFK